MFRFASEEFRIIDVRSIARGGAKHICGVGTPAAFASAVGVAAAMVLRRSRAAPQKLFRSPQDAAASARQRDGLDDKLTPGCHSPRGEEKALKNPMNKSTTKRMFNAVQENDLATLDAILGEHPDAMESVGEHNRLVRDKTPLMFALQCLNLSLAEALLDRGAKASAVMAGGPGLSVLALCVKFAYCDAAQHDDWIRLATRLLDEGADPTSALWPALHGFGGIVKRADLIRLLLDRGANSDQEIGNSGNTVRELVALNRRLYPDEVLELFHVKNRR